MKRIFVKYCGFTRKEDVDCAVSLGVDALGFIFYPGSKRYVTPETVRRITADVPESVAKIGVFVNESPSHVNRVSDEAQLSMVQLFAQEVTSVDDFIIPVIRSYRISRSDDLPVADVGERILLDTYTPHEAGGSGIPFDWAMLNGADIAGRAIVAGGITADNVTTLLASVAPYGIDVSSGIETEKGIKSPEKMKALMNNVEEFYGN
ncbi:MAG: phosphoribosylanthranilate isomerase [Spirochaetota bacterium]